jgi:Ca-activated chloride channel family protein
LRERAAAEGARVRAALLVLALPLLVGFDLVQSPNRAVEDGNARLKAGKAEEALGHYDKALKSLAAEPGAHFDRGAALFALGRFEESAQEFLRATEARTAPLKEAAFYNLGNGYFKLEKYGEAIAAYRRALNLDPSDAKAKWNLELALKKKKDQDDKDKQKKDQQSQDDNKKSGDDKDKKDQQSQQNDKQDPKQDPKQDQQAKQDQPKPQNDDKDKDKDKQAAGDKDKQDQNKQQGESMSPTPPPPSDQVPDTREIEAVLDSLERSPKDLEKQRAHVRAIRRAPPRKNW